MIVEDRNSTLGLGLELQAGVTSRLVSYFERDFENANVLLYFYKA